MCDSSNESQSNIDDVVRRVLGGASSEFETIVRRYEKPLRVWMVSHTGSFVDIDDVLQAAFLTAYSKLHEYEAGSNFGGWIFSIARFQLLTELSRLRRQANNQHQFSAELLQREAERQKDANFFMAHDRLEYLEHCLGRLQRTGAVAVRRRDPIGGNGNPARAFFDGDQKGVVENSPSAAHVHFHTHVPLGGFS